MKRANLRYTIHFSLILFILLILLPAATWAGVTVVGELTREHELEPGESFEETILIRNRGETPAMVKLYLRDYFFTADGRTTYGDPGTLERSNAGWLDFEEETITVSPQSTRSFTFNGQVPADGALEGTYWSVVMVEPQQVERVQPPEGEDDQPTLGINIRRRSALQLVTNIRETGSGRLEITDRRLVQDEDSGRTFLELDLENTGERWLRIETRAELYDAEGRKAHDIEGPGGRLYPGTSIRRRIELTDAEPGTYQALVLLDAGEDRIWGAQYTLNLE